MFFKKWWLSWLIFFSLAEWCWACNDDDKIVISKCYTAHFAANNNPSMATYYYNMTNMFFKKGNANFLCQNFSILENCIGEERFNSCVSRVSLSYILNKTLSEAEELIYIFQRGKIYCSYLPQLGGKKDAPANDTYCYDSVMITTRTFWYCSPVSYLHLRRRRTESYCSLYQDYINCSITNLAAECSISYAQMHCDIMNLHIQTYHSYCNLKPINCSAYNYQKLQKDALIISNAHDATIRYNNQFVQFFYILTNYAQYISLTFFAAIFFSFFKKKSVFKTSFYALFLMIFFTDVATLVSHIVNFFSTFYAFEILKFLETHYVDTIPPTFFMISLNRFTAIMFPLKYKTIWSIPLTVFAILFSILLSIIPYTLYYIVTLARKKTPYLCDTEISIYCTLYSIDQGELMFDLYDWIIRGRFIYNLLVCGICAVMLFGASIKFFLTSKKTTANIVDAEKRLFVITITELFLAFLYVITIFSNLWQTRLGDILQYLKVVIFFIYHFGSIIIFLIISKVTRDAYFQFYFLDRIFDGTLKKYIKRHLQ